ncbi:MAG TPA: hypothetical protein PK307_00490 [Spirochaetota bacterium]|nr:hypothetical protein [Spirochaetota bacterium]HOD13233.1 hypothetical protein [Spirochaetota bacterium]HPG48959.1 hypothetical protein [Spirochaetota bacterium]HPN10468.1 hypothetical protein [Spirochaetota bacterium]HQL80648.1 hypothetical protein [Spirochaetota bacterium]
MKRFVEIRKIRPDDLHDVFVLGLEFFPGQDGRSPILSWNETNLAAVLADDLSLSLVAARKNSIEGFLIARIDNPGRAGILWIAARGPEAVRIRNDLCQAFIDGLPETITRIRVAVPESNPEMMDFFGKFGFTDSEHVVIMENFFRKNT